MGWGEKQKTTHSFLSTKDYQKTGNSVKVHFVDGQGKGVWRGNVFGRKVGI